jgi:hypothetical protein
LIRQVPNTQEVYISPTSGDSIIIEVLERVSQRDYAEAARSTIRPGARSKIFPLVLTCAFFRYHFEAIADDNDAVSFSVDEVNEISNTRGDGIPSIIVLSGRQGVRKFNRTSVDDVRIFLALYRLMLEEKGVDLVLSLNFPMNTSEGVVRTEEFSAAKETFRSIATSFHIIDLCLFA